MELSSSTSLTTVRQVLVAADHDPRAAGASASAARLVVAIAAYREERMPAAEEWLALAFRFTQVAPDSLMANGLKDEMRASYDNLLESMTGKPGATGSVWQRMRGYLRDDGEAHYGRSPRGG